MTQITWQPWDNHVSFPKATGGIQTFASLGCRSFRLLKSLNQSSPVWRSKVCFLQHLNFFRLNLNTDGSNILVFLHQHHTPRTVCSPEQTRTEALRSNKQEELLNIDLAFLMILSKSGLYFYAMVQTDVASLHVWWRCHIIQMVCCRWVMKSYLVFSYHPVCSHLWYINDSDYRAFLWPNYANFPRATIAVCIQEASLLELLMSFFKLSD